MHSGWQDGEELFEQAGVSLRRNQSGAYSQIVYRLHLSLAAPAGFAAFLYILMDRFQLCTLCLVEVSRAATTQRTGHS